VKTAGNNTIDLKHLVILVIAVAVWSIVWLPEVSGIDFYPIHFATRLLLEGRSPYGLEATAQLILEQPAAPMLAAGVGYPLPFLIILMPLGFISEYNALFIWMILTVSMALLTVFLSRDRYAIYSLIMFGPFVHNIILAQASGLWFGLTLLLIISSNKRWDFTTGLLMAILVYKPQAGLIFAIGAGLLAVWDRRYNVLYSAVFNTVLLLTAALFLHPNWVSDWLWQLGVYMEVNHFALPMQPGLMILPIIMYTARHRARGYWAVLAVLQVFLFPIITLYSFIPLFICWIVIGGRIALLGTAISVIWFLIPVEYSAYNFYVTVVLPLAVGSICSYILSPRKRSSDTGPVYPTHT